MSEPEPPAPSPASQLSSPPQTPVIADALRALGPDYEEALVNSIAARVDELAREREARARTVVPSHQPSPARFPGAPAPLPVPIPVPQATGASAPEPEPRHEPARRGNPALPVSILSLIFGFVMTVVALTAGFSLGGGLALVAILIIWVSLTLINLAAWRYRP